MDDIQYGTCFGSEFRSRTQILSGTETKKFDYYLLRNKSRMDDVMSRSL